MASKWRLAATRIIGIIEVVISVRIRPKCGVVNFRCQCQRCTAAPATDELGGEEFPFLLGASIRLEEAIEGTDTRLIFAKADIRAVPTEYVRLRHWQGNASFTRISHDKL